jgi:hypothetical protein
MMSDARPRRAPRAGEYWFSPFWVAGGINGGFNTACAVFASSGVIE